MALSVVILAAGKGSRMHSALPKVLHPLAGHALLDHVLATANTLSQHILVVYGYEGAQICQHLQDTSYQLVEQKQQLGTGHAVMQALPHLSSDHQVLVLYGDVPLITPSTLQQFIAQVPTGAIGLLTAIVEHPHGLGRIIRDEQQNLIKVIESKDATPQQLQIKEINSGILLAPAALLSHYLPKVTANNQQHEYYLPDIIPAALANGIQVIGHCIEKPAEVMGINDRIQLTQAERYYQQQAVQHLQQHGVTVLDPKRLDIRGTVQHENDITIDANVILEGQVILGKNCHIGANSILRNVTLGENVIIHPFSFIDGAIIGAHAQIGPYARIRPDTRISEHAKVGNFVEVKKSTLGQHSKVNHLSYIGDANIGSHVNIGAGTITCNYDGRQKHTTTIENNVFIGSNTALIAPVTIGEHAVIGAGSVISKDAPAAQLTLARAQQKSIGRWPRKEMD